MNANQLLDGIGDAKGTYIWEAQRHRCGEIPPKKPIPLRKTLLIAAVIALMLLLVGCAVAYVLSLNDLVLGESSEVNRLTGDTEVHSVLSLQGLAGTPGYQASKEWYEWEHAYDPDGAIRDSQSAYSEDFGEEYQAYNLYTREMKDKVDALCEKYNLELLGPVHTDTDIAYTFQAMGIDGILKPNANTEADYGSYTYYENGSFEIFLRLSGESNPWPYDTLVRFCCNRKNTFSSFYTSIGPDGTYEEWVYTTSDGIDVLMVMQEDILFGNSAFMMADRGDYFFFIDDIDTQAYSEMEGKQNMDRAGLEAIAEFFDFSIQPQAVSRETAQAGDTRYQDYLHPSYSEEELAEFQAQWNNFLGKSSYEARVEFHLLQTKYPERLGYTFQDLDGNGIPELIIGRDGYICSIYTLKDGETEEIYGGFNETGVYLAEDGYLIRDHYVANRYPYRYFEKVADGKLVTEKLVCYNPHIYPENESHWRLGISEMDNQPISEEEFQKIYNSAGKRVVLDMLPLIDYPAENTQLKFGRIVTTYGTSDLYDDLIRQKIINPMELGNGEFALSEFALIDLDGDGKDELYLDDYVFDAVYTLLDGSVRVMFESEEVNLCQGNVIELVHTYSGNNVTYCYYRMNGGEVINVDYLRYDEDRDSANPWFRSTDATGQDISLVPISRTEFESLRAKYAPLELDMKPVTEYPLG
ncbi:MAG: hypothetical protein ACI4PH_06015 [Faecousia sp.]